MTTRLLFGGLLITVTLVVSVSGFLLISRASQGEEAVRSEARNRDATAYQLLAHVTQPQTQFAATTLASARAMQIALQESAATRVAAVTQLFAAGTSSTLPGSHVIVLDAAGVVVATDECGSGVPLSSCTQQHGAHITSSTTSVAGVLGETKLAACATEAGAKRQPATCPLGFEGVEAVGGTLPAFDVAVPVRAAGGAIVGVVAFSSPLQAQFQRLGAAILYTPVLVTGGARSTLFRFDPHNDYAMSTSASPNGSGATLSQANVRAVDTSYPSPGGDVTASFTALNGPDGQVAAYLGVEVPKSLFEGQTGADERTIVLMGFTAILLVYLAITFFTRRFVVAPVARLERGVRQIAAGDLSTDVPVTSNDELGRLAGNVNVMRAQIAGYIGHLDASLERLETVSGALTTTTDGVATLRRNVLLAAQAIGGDGAEAMLVPALTEGAEAAAGDPLALTVAEVNALRAGERVRREPDGDGAALLAVPMTYQGTWRGALAVMSPRPLADTDERTLAALANNAIVALENTRLFEQERQTVHRLRQLDSLKSEFLTTMQHELRTPVHAIRGELEVMLAAWEALDEAARQDLLRDMQVSARQLGEIVENIVVFSLLNTEAISLRREPVLVETAVTAAVQAVRAGLREELPVTLTLTLEPEQAVDADRSRLEQVLRALLDNAVKFTPAGGHVHVITRGIDGRVRIEVIDDGIGIAAEDLLTVFDHLRQADGSKTRKFGGMGMGLALARRVAEAHGATIGLTSVAGAGTHVTLDWPAADAPPASNEPTGKPVARRALAGARKGG